MEFEKPSDADFTVYSKSGCPNCMKIKALLKEKYLLFNVVDCDEYLIEDKSSLVFNGEKAKTIKNVKGKMYGVEFGKSSKETGQQSLYQ